MAAFRTVKNPEIIAPAWIFAVGVLYFVTIEVLYIWNALLIRGPSPLVAAFSISLVYGLWMFTRLMIRHNR